MNTGAKRGRGREREGQVGRNENDVAREAGASAALAADSQEEQPEEETRSEAGGKGGQRRGDHATVPEEMQMIEMKTLHNGMMVTRSMKRYADITQGFNPPWGPPISRDSDGKPSLSRLAQQRKERRRKERRDLYEKETSSAEKRRQRDLHMQAWARYLELHPPQWAAGHLACDDDE
jgi:hypothetical protein